MQHYFFIPVDGKYRRLDFANVLYMEGCRNYVKVVTTTKNYLVLMTMKRIEQIMPAHLFLRIHKSYIVSLNNITEFDRSRVYLTDKVFPIGDQYKGSLERSLLILQENSGRQLSAVPMSVFQHGEYAG
jgi:DNA-binding LytR/AlgR family response regulator